MTGWREDREACEMVRAADAQTAWVQDPLQLGGGGGLQACFPTPPALIGPPGNGQACPSPRKDMGVDRGTCQDPSPQHGDPDPGEGQTQAKCGVWLTATGRGHRDTQPPTHRTRRVTTCPGPLRENSSGSTGIQGASTRTNQHTPARINQTTT